LHTTQVRTAAVHIVCACFLYSSFIPQLFVFMFYIFKTKKTQWRMTVS